MYPGMGFIMTANKDSVNEVCRLFREAGMASQVIGTVVKERSLTLTKGEEKATIFNFCSEGITNI